MKLKQLSTALLTLMISITPSLAERPLLDQGDLRQCIKWDELADTREGNINKLEEVLEEVKRTLRRYDDQLEEIDQALSHTVGYRRSELIQRYNSLVGERNRFAEVARMAAKKRKKRIGQYNRLVDKLDQQCDSFDVLPDDWEAVCGGVDSGFCARFD